MNELAAGSRLALPPLEGQDSIVRPAAVAGRRNASLHYLRGLAALAVLLFHAAHYLGDLRGDGRFLQVFSGFWGGYGVAVFFALSGYLIAEVLRRDEPGRFLIGRVARIYPLMLILVALFAALFALTGNPRGINVMSLTLIPSGLRGYFLGVEWTLLYEMTYYVAFALFGFVGLARYRTAVVCVWVAAICIAYAMGIGRETIPLPVLSEIPLSVTSLPFLLGYLTSAADRKGWLPPFLIVPAALLALATLFAPEEHSRLLVGLSASLLIAAAVRAPAMGGRNWLGRAGSQLGDASYALYLCHVPIILILAHLLSDAIPTPVVWLIWVSSALAFALVLGPLDVAMHRRLKRAIETAPPSRSTILGLAFTTAFIAVAGITEWDARIDAGHLAQAKKILSSEAIPAGPAVKVSIDTAERLANGTWIARGYIIDLDRPRLATHVAIRQNGKILVMAGMRRMRAATASALGRPDLKTLRFGFMVIFPKGLSCADGPLEGLATFEDGRLVAIPSGALSEICRQP